MEQFKAQVAMLALGSITSFSEALAALRSRRTEDDMLSSSSGVFNTAKLTFADGSWIRFNDENWTFGLTDEAFRAIPKSQSGRIEGLPDIYLLFSDVQRSWLHNDDQSYCEDLDEQMRCMMAELG